MKWILGQIDIRSGIHIKATKIDMYIVEVGLLFLKSTSIILSFNDICGMHVGCEARTNCHWANR